MSEECQFTSVSVRCVCGARYRISSKGVERITLDDITVAAVADIETDPALKPEDRVTKLKSLILRAKRARDAYNTGYGEVIHKAERAEEEWHKKASVQVVDALNKRSDMSGAELINRIAVAKTSSGGTLFVEGEPWNPGRMSEPGYVRNVAVKLNVAHILGE